ncbi:hypothetical protein OROHE_026893 [Orobanche hederae]
MSDELFRSEAHFKSLLISDLILFCSAIFSNPLYISYFILFSPYLLKLITFLFPLFITTFLFFLTGIVHENSSADLSLTSSVLENLRIEKGCYRDERFPGFDDLGIHEILFGTCLMNCVSKDLPEDSEKKSEENLEPSLDMEKDPSFGEGEGFDAKTMEENNPGRVPELKKSCPGLEERRLENFLKILDQFERLSTASAEEKKNMKFVTKIDRAVTQGVRHNAATKVSFNGGEEHTPLVKAHSQRITSGIDHSDDEDEKEHSVKKVGSFRAWDDNNNNNNHFGNFGSMRKEKEWNRTLACKLFEERHSIDGGEGMDSLWEAYEMDSDKSMRETRDVKKRNKKTSGIEFYEEFVHGKEEEKDDDDDDDEEEEEVVDEQLCCLQAIKMSGMRRPNIVKISKAIKGFGWLHHLSKHSKKVHNNGYR